MTPRLSVAQLAERWGCSRQHVYNLIERGELRAMRIGNLIRLRPEDVAEYENRQCARQEPPAPLSASLSAGAVTMSRGGRVVAHTGYLAGLKSRQKRAAS